MTVSIRSSIWSWMLLSNALAQGQEPHRGQPPGLVLGRDRVGGELLVDEPIEAEVLVERPDDVIAIGVGERADPVVAEHQHAVLGVGVAGDVEPVAAPPLAVMRRSQQAIDDPGEGIRRPVVFERLDLLGGRRQADQVVSRPGGASVRRSAGGDGVSPAASSRGQDERVDRRARPVRWCDRGDRRLADRLIGPVRAGRFEVEAGGGFLATSRGRLDAVRHDGALLRPIARAWRSSRRAASPWAASADARPCTAPPGRAGWRRHRRGRPPGPCRRPSASPSRLSSRRPPLGDLRLRRVALVTMLDQHGPHLRLEEVDAAESDLAAARRRAAQRNHANHRSQSRAVPRSAHFRVRQRMFHPKPR